MTASAAGAGRFELTCTAARHDLALILALLERAANDASLAPSDANELRLAVEEACVNVIEHGYPPGCAGPLTVAIRIDAERATVVISDRAAPFDPRHAPAPDLDSDWHERQIGGLGWHLIRNVIDEIGHVSLPGGGNRLTLTKYRTHARETHGNPDQ